jgi:hypothetical protein
VFERIVETCIAAGLVGGEGFAVDASLIAADANKQRSIADQDAGIAIRSSRAVKEYLATLDDPAPRPLNPTRISAEVTRDIAERLAKIAKRLEERYDN